MYGIRYGNRDSESLVEMIIKGFSVNKRRYFDVKKTFYYEELPITEADEDNYCFIIKNLFKLLVIPVKTGLQALPDNFLVKS